MWSKVGGWNRNGRLPSAANSSHELQQRGWRFSNEQIQFRNTVEMAVQRPEEELLAAMKSKTRYNIRLAGRKGIMIRHGTPDDFAVIAEMYRETAVRDGFTIRPLDYYLDIWQAFYDAGMAQPLMAEYEGDPVARRCPGAFWQTASSTCTAHPPTKNATGCPIICCNGKRSAGPERKVPKSTISGARPMNLSKPIRFGASGGSKKALTARLCVILGPGIL